MGKWDSNSWPLVRESSPITTKPVILVNSHLNFSYNFNNGLTYVIRKSCTSKSCRNFTAMLLGQILFHNIGHLWTIKPYSPRCRTKREDPVWQPQSGELYEFKLYWDYFKRSSWVVGKNKICKLVTAFLLLCKKKKFTIQRIHKFQRRELIEKKHSKGRSLFCVDYAKCCCFEIWLVYHSK